MKFFCIPLFTCKHGIVDSLDYSQLRLEEVPKEILKSRKYIEELLLNVNAIEDLPKEFFRCTKIQKLDVSENRIKVLPPEIRCLEMLLDFNLSKNEFVEIPEEIGDCRMLTSLNISTNIVPNLPKSIVNLSALTHLNVSDNPLTQLPADIHQLTSLQYLDASQCELRFLPPSIVRLVNLKMIDICENYLIELPKGMDGLASLEILDVHNNVIAHLPEDILRCQALRTLDFTSNHLSELPVDLGDLSNLTELYMCDNQVTSLPTSIGQLKKLEVLKASKNCIRELTPAICSCVLLTDLILCENQLQELPSSLGNLKRLQFLDLNVNNLRNLPTTIGGCGALAILNLRHNQLQELPMEIGRLSNLKVLDLIDNNLTYLPYTLTVLYQNRLSALMLSFTQPSLPKLSITNEPVMNVKVLTCYLLPQKSENQCDFTAVRQTARSCIGGARVSFANEGLRSLANGSTAAATDDDEEKNLPVGRFERYDTPHPKPFAPKNLANRNSGDFSSVANNNTPNNSNNNDNKTADATAENAQGTAKSSSIEMRPLRSVLKRRPISANIQDEKLLNEQMEQKIIRFVRSSPSSSFDWTISGGADTLPYKGRLGIFVSHVVVGGLAERQGFCVDDRIVAINGSKLDVGDTTHTSAVELLQNSGNVVEVVVERVKPVENSNNCKLASPSFEHQKPAHNNLLAETENFDDDHDVSFTSSSANSNSNSAARSGEIIAVTVQRDFDSVSSGFTVDGGEGRPLIISSITPGSYIQRSEKLRVGDRLLSVNGVNVKGISYDHVTSLLSSNSKADIYLVVERGCMSPPSLKRANFDDLVSSKLHHARSLPLLVQSSKAFSQSPPPVFPRSDHFARNNQINKEANNLHVVPNRSMDFLLDPNVLGRLRMPTSIAPPRPDTKSAFNSVAVAKSLKRNSYNSAVNDFNSKPSLKFVEDSKNPSEQFTRLLNIGKPLSTSSPIPHELITPSQIPVLQGNAGTKSIKMPNSQKSSIETTTSNLGDSSTKVLPPPLAPKPKIFPERLNFSSKLQHFEEEINAQQKNQMAPFVTGGSKIPLTESGASFAGFRRSGIPMKKPLVSSEDLQKLRDEEEKRQINSNRRNETEDGEGADTVSELYTKDACFNEILANGANGPLGSAVSGPSVVRTRNAEIRAERAARVLVAQRDSPSLASVDEANLDASLAALDDAVSLSRASSSMSSLEQKAADLEKRQAWRQARLKSMDVESQRTDDVLKLINSIPSSPIPIK